MRMARYSKEHSSKVEAWIKSTTVGLSSQELINHFETTFDKLWEQSSNKISEVTLSAVMDRAIFTSSDTHKFMLELKLGPSGIRWDEFREKTTELNRNELKRAFTSLITQFIVISSNITGGILTDTLYKTLLNIKPKKKPL
jgi:hypothetical protein